MGAYLSEPVKEKHSEKGGNGKLKFGATSVQGWRISQEDAHNCILNFDDDSSLFAVYDGHGGSEVSEYTAKYLPDFLKSLDLWKNGDLVQALEHGFLSFDESLTKDTVLEELKQMAGVKTEEDGSDENAENKQELLEEARLPLEEVLRRYGCYFVPADDDDFDHKKFKSPLLQAKKRSHQKKLTNGEAKAAENGSEAVEESSALNSSDINDVTSAISSSEDPAKNVACVRSEAQSASPGSTKKHKMVASPDSTSAVDGEVVADMNGSNRDSACSPQLKRSRKDNSAAEAHPADTRDNEHCVDQSNSARNEVDCVTEANSTATVDTASSASADEASNKQPTDAAAAALATDSDQRPSKVGVSKDAETVSSSNAVDSSSEGASEASKRSHCKSESQACDSTSTAFVSNPSSWPSRPNLHEIDQESSKKRLLDADPSPAPKRKAPAFDKDVSSDESESDDADFVCGLEESSDDADDTSDESASSDAENDAKPDSDEELEQAWHEGVDMIEDSEDDEEFGEAPEEMFAVPSGDTPGVDSGTTACVALIKGKTLYVANAGDSRCVICRNGKAVDMSIDHKPEDEIERKRIENAGGQITADGRVNGGLNLSRAIGDHFYKKTETLPLREQMISSLPDVRTETLTNEDKFIVLACDGIWNSLSSQEVIDFVDEKLTSGVSLVEICEAMCDKCLAPSTAGDGTGCDNMTVIIVDLRSLFAENESTNSNHAEEKLACDSATN